MKSPPEYPIRRIAVFTGYGPPEPVPTWDRVVRRPAATTRGEDPDQTVIRLEPVSRRAELQHAA